VSDLPTGWTLVPVSQVTRLENGDRSKNYPSKQHRLSSGVPFINAGHLKDGRICHDSMDYISRERFEILSSGKTRDGDVLFCLRGSLGKAALVDDIGDGAIASSLVIARPSQALSSKYLYYFLSSPFAKSAIAKFDNGTAQPNLASRDLGRFLMPLSPIEEQGRIVAAIEEQFSRLNAGVATLERVRQNLKRMRTAVLVDSFAHLEATLSATSGQELFPFVTSGSRGWAKYYSSDGPEFLRIGNVPRTGIDLDLAEVQRVTPPANAEGRRTRVQSGDLLISITADLGRVAVIPQTLGEAYINQHLALARPIDGAVPRYLAWYLASPFGMQQWDNLRRGATKIGLGLDDIRSLRIPIPTSGLQQSTVDVIEAAWVGFEWLEQSLLDCERRAQHLRSSLLATAFSGRLVAQDPTDEPAAILLERIAAERASSTGNRPRRTRKPRVLREKVTA
jgi:type I restriction enzyme S subunit